MSISVVLLGLYGRLERLRCHLVEDCIEVIGTQLSGFGSFVDPAGLLELLVECYGTVCEVWKDDDLPWKELDGVDELKKDSIVLGADSYATFLKLNSKIA